MFTEVALHCAWLLKTSKPLPVPADPNISLTLAQPVIGGPSLERLKLSMTALVGNEVLVVVQLPVITLMSAVPNAVDDAPMASLTKLMSAPTSVPSAAAFFPGLVAAKVKSLFA